MDITFYYAITFLSEWHVGSGRGRPGDVDRLVKRRRRTRLPYVPAKTLTGVWRWEAENIAAAFAERTGSPDQGALADLVRVVFGDNPTEDAAARRNRRAPRGRPTRGRPRSAAASVRPADFHPDVAAALEADHLQPHVTMVVSQTAIDDLGVARTKTLRRTEVVRRGAQLHGRVDIDLSRISQTQHTRALALLIVSAARLRRIGGKRNRGMGRIQLLVEPAGLVSEQIPTGTDSLGWALTVLTNSGTSTPLTLAPTPAVTLVNPAAEDNLETLELVITAIDPVVIEDVVVGNVTRTLDHIPGARLLAIIARALRNAGVNPDPLIDAGLLQVRAGLPDVGGRRGLPVPLSLHAPRRPFRFQGQTLGPIATGGAGVVNLLAGDTIPVGPDVAMYEQIRSGWIADHRGSDIPVYRPRPSTHVETMNTIDDSRGRTHADVGGLYSYEAIDDRETFRCVVVAPAPIADILRTVFRSGCTDRVGTSKKDDFGRVWIELAPNISAEPIPAREPVGAFTLWCVSPLLVDAGNGTAVTSLADVASALSGALHTHVTVETDLNGSRCWSRPFRSDTWKSGWGLPNPSLIGVAAGSVGTFRCEPPVPVEALRQLELLGLGDRRPAGFGELRIDHPTAVNTRLGHQVSRPPAPLVDTPEGNDGDSAFSRAVRVAAWRRRVQSASAVANLDQLTIVGSNQLSSATLGGYRAAIAQLEGPDATVWLPIKLRAEAQQSALQQPTIGGSLATLPGRVLGELGLEPPVPDPLALLWREAVMSIVDGAVRNAIRGRLHGDGNELQGDHSQNVDR